MKRLYPIAFAAALLGGLASLGHAQVNVGSYVASLDAAQEVGTGSTSLETGTASLDLFDLGGGDYRLDFTIDITAGLNPVGFDGISDDNGGADNMTGLHIHNAPRGSNGGIVYNLYGPVGGASDDLDGDLALVVNGDNTTTITGQWDPTDATSPNGFAASLLALSPGQDSDLYFNVHSVAFGGGVIRGQIQAVPEPSAYAALIGVLALALVLWRRQK